MADNHYQAAERLFTAKTLYRELQQYQADEHGQAPSFKIVFNDIVQLAQGNPKVDTPQMMQQVNQSMVLRRQYLQIVQSLAFANSPLQAAASSVLEINSRQSAEFELLFKRDKQFSGQVYVILKIPHPTEKQHNQGVRVSCCSVDLISAIHFPPIVDGKSQLLMEESDNRFINMFDAEFAIYLS
jgi:hypothetical protein